MLTLQINAVADVLAWSVIVISILIVFVLIGINIYISKLKNDIIEEEFDEELKSLEEMNDTFETREMVLDDDLIRKSEDFINEGNNNLNEEGHVIGDDEDFDKISITDEEEYLNKTEENLVDNNIKDQTPPKEEVKNQTPSKEEVKKQTPLKEEVKEEQKYTEVIVFETKDDKLITKVKTMSSKKK